MDIRDDCLVHVLGLALTTDFGGYLYLAGLVRCWRMSIDGISGIECAMATWLATNCGGQPSMATIGSMWDNVGDDGASEKDGKLT